MKGKIMTNLNLSHNFGIRDPGMSSVWNSTSLTAIFLEISGLRMSSFDNVCNRKKEE